MIFFKRKIPVLSIGREKLKFGYVLMGTNPTLIEINEFIWAPEILASVIEKLKNIVHGKLRILVNNELSYVLTLRIPKNIDDDRKFLYSYISQEIPEKLTDDDWDFKVISFDGKTKRIVVFSPVHEVFSQILTALTNNDFEIEAVEPEVIAQERSPDPFIGIALKSDIEGKDENVLNIGKNKKKTRFDNYLLPSAAILFVLLALTSFNKFLLTKTVSPSPTPTTLEIIKTPQPKFELLNGSGNINFPNDVKNYLSEKGYENVVITNVPVFSYKGIHIEFKNSDEKFQNIINELLIKYPNSTVSGVLDNASVFDVILNLGKQK